jgi:hypothetical protein
MITDVSGRCVPTFRKMRTDVSGKCVPMFRENAWRRFGNKSCFLRHHSKWISDVSYCGTATPRRAFLHLPTSNRSYDQTVRKQISFQAAIKMALTVIFKHVLNRYLINFLSGSFKELCPYYLATESPVILTPSTCWRVYIPPHFALSTYDHVFRRYPVSP